MKEPTVWTIGEVAKRAGVRTSAIRYYEQQKLLPAPARVSGQRRYDASVLRALDVIALAQEAGFTIAEVRQLLHGFSKRTPAGARWRGLAERKLEEVEERIAKLRDMKTILARLIECECPTLDDCSIGRKRASAR